MSFPPEFAWLRFMADEVESDEAKLLRELPPQYAGAILHALRRAVCGEPPVAGDAEALSRATDVLALMDYHQVPLRFAGEAMRRASHADAWADALHARRIATSAAMLAPLDPIQQRQLLRSLAHTPVGSAEASLMRLDEIMDLRCVGPSAKALERCGLTFPSPFDPVDTSVSLVGLRSGLHPALTAPNTDLYRPDLTGQEQRRNDSVWAALEGALRAFPGELVIAGGFVTSLLCPNTRFTRLLDADLFVHGVTAARASEIAQELFRMSGSGILSKSPHAQTMAFTDFTVQLVLRLFDSREDILRSFDLPACEALLEFDPTTGRLEAFASDRFVLAVKLGAVWVDLDAVDSVSTYTARLLKYAMKGFRILVPGLCRACTGADASLRITNPSADVSGLRLLLTIEWMVNHAPGGWWRTWQVAAADMQYVHRQFSRPCDLKPYPQSHIHRQSADGLMVYVNCYMSARGEGGHFYTNKHLNDLANERTRAPANTSIQVSTVREWSRWTRPTRPLLDFYGDYRLCFL